MSSRLVPRPFTVPGHGLQREGRPHDGMGNPIPYTFHSGDGVLGAKVKREGRGLCACGAMSEVLETNAARQKWHQAHKVHILGHAERCCREHNVHSRPHRGCILR